MIFICVAIVIIGLLFYFRLIGKVFVVLLSAVFLSSFMYFAWVSWYQDARQTFYELEVASEKYFEDFEISGFEGIPSFFDCEILEPIERDWFYILGGRDVRCVSVSSTQKFVFTAKVNFRQSLLDSHAKIVRHE